MRLRHAVRSLRQTPWYSLTVVGTIALSMALATTVFAVADGALFRPLPYRNPTQLFLINGPFSQLPSIAQIRQWATSAPDIKMAAYRSPSALGATSTDSPLRLFAAKVGPEFFDVLGQHPLAGGFQPEHFVPSGGRLPVLVSYGLWQRMFAGSQGVIGNAFELPGAVESGRQLSFIVVGILPRDFLFPNAGDPPDLILPFAVAPADEADRNRSYATVVARIPDGVALDGVKTRVDAVVQTQGFRDSNADLRAPGQATHAGVSLTSVADLKATIGIVQYRSAFVASLVLVGLACMNVIVLGLARSRQRRRDIAVRRALGASRWHLVRQAFAETVPLAIAGSALGLAIAPGLVRQVISLMDARSSVLAAPEVGWRVLGFAGLISFTLVATVVLMQERFWRAGSMHSAGRWGTSANERRGRWAPMLVGFQIALAMVLTIGGTLLVGSLWWAWRQDPGFTPGQAAIIDLSYGNAPAADRSVILKALVDRLSAQPGIHIGLVGGPILRRSSIVPAIVRPPGTFAAREQSIGFGGDAFAILGIRPLQGRLFTPEEERSTAPVAVVSESLARRYWPGVSAVGQVLQTSGQSPRAITVIGVVRDARFSGPDNDSYSQIYWPQAGAAGSLLIAGDGTADETIATAMGVIRSLGSPIAVLHAAAVADDLGEPMRPRAFAAWLYGGFATSSLLIVAVGLIGFVAMSTSARTKEIGIRSAIGATRAQLTSMIVREQLGAVLAGLLAGAIGASWATQYVKRSLYGFSPHDSRLWAIAAGTIILVALIGSLIPAWRAVRIAPVKALRAD